MAAGHGNGNPEILAGDLVSCGVSVSPFLSSRSEQASHLQAFATDFLSCWGDTIPVLCIWDCAKSSYFWKLYCGTYSLISA